MNDTENPRESLGDEAVEKELAGVPEELLEKGQDGATLEDALNSLRDDLEKAQQEMLYAKAEVQNVRRRMEKDIQDTRAYAATVFGLHGITRVAAMGLPLDPNQHQAMLEVPTDEAEPGTIVQEMQAGYMIKDRLLRPAMVGVAKKPG